MPDSRFFLTFDGGPNPPGSDAVLAALDRHEITATFFLEGWRLEDEADCAQRIVDAGHEIGNHSFSHSNFDELTPELALHEIVQADEMIRSNLGISSRVFRPPWGRLTPDVSGAILDAGFDIILWSVSVRDWEGPDAEGVAGRLLGGAHDGGIVALHDRVEWNPDVLDRIVPALRADGYDFFPISEAPAGDSVLRAPGR